MGLRASLWSSRCHYQNNYKHRYAYSYVEQRWWWSRKRIIIFIYVVMELFSKIKNSYKFFILFVIAACGTFAVVKRVHYNWLCVQTKENCKRNLCSKTMIFLNVRDENWMKKRSRTLREAKEDEWVITVFRSNVQ